MITQRAAVATLSVFWVAFFLVRIGSVVRQFSRPLGIFPPPPTGYVRPEGPHLENLGVLQFGLLGLMILLYGGFRIHHARKFGDRESDEGQDQGPQGHARDHAGGARAGPRRDRADDHRHREG